VGGLRQNSQADDHIDEFAVQIGRYIVDLEVGLLSKTRAIERIHRAVFRELKLGLCTPPRGRRLLRQMRSSATEIHTLCQAHGLSGYRETVYLVEHNAGGLWQQSGRPYGLEAMDAIFVLRHQIQSTLLEQLQHGEPSPILSIIDDVQQSFSAAYFLVDQWLLGNVFYGLDV
jgi:hypothetical protein